MSKNFRYTALTMMLGLVFMSGATTAYADRGHGYDHGHKAKYSYRFNNDSYENNYRDGWRSPETIIVIHDDQRDVIRDYLYRDYRGHCPHGLAKKHNGCLPPGHARYVIGQPLPSAVVYSTLPSTLLVRLQPAPTGYRYVRVDQDVLLIAEATKKVIDAVTLLSAVGR